MRELIAFYCAALHKLRRAQDAKINNSPVILGVNTQRTAAFGAPLNPAVANAALIRGRTFGDRGAGKTTPSKNQVIPSDIPGRHGNPFCSTLSACYHFQRGEEKRQSLGQRTHVALMCTSTNRSSTVQRAIIQQQA